MKNCEEIKDLLSPYLDNMVNSEERRLVKEHVKECPGCRKELEELREILSMMDDLASEELEAPEDFKEKVMLKLEEKEKGDKDNKGKDFTARVLEFIKKPWVPVVIAASFVFAFFLPSVFWGGMGSGDKSVDALEESAVARSTQFMESFEPKTANLMSLEADTAGEEKAATSQIERKIIKRAALSLEVLNYKETELKIEETLKDKNGYIAFSNKHVYQENPKLIQGNISIRIPIDEFENALIDMETFGEVKRKDINTQDVTEEYIDLESRVKNLKIKEDRLIEIIKKQGNLSELLAVENELANTRAQIDSIEGRIKYLNNQVSFSTIDLNIREVKDIEKTVYKNDLKNILAQSKEAIIKTVNTLIDLLVKFVVWVAATLPVLAILIIAYFPIKFAIKKIKK